MLVGDGPRLVTAMKKLSVAEARRAQAPASRPACRAGFARAAIPRAASASSKLNDGSCSGQHANHCRRQLANYESEIKHLGAGCSVTVEGEVRASPAKGQADRSAGRSDRGPRLGRPGNVSAAKKTPLVRVPADHRPICGRAPTPSARSPGCGIASAARSTISSRSKVFSTSIRRSSPPAIAKGPARCSRSPRSTRPSCRKQDAAVDYAQDFFGRPAFLTVSGQLEGGDLRLRAGQGLHVRPDLSGRELEHLPAPGRVLDGRAGDGLLRAGRQHGPGRGVPQAHLRATRSSSAPRTCNSSTSTSTPTVLDHARRQSSASEFVQLAYTEAVDILQKSGQAFEFPVAWGNDLQAEHERYLTEKHSSGR